MPAVFRRHLVGKTPINICYCDIAEIRFVAKLVIIPIFFINQRIAFYLINAINLRPLTPHIMQCYNLYPQNGGGIVAIYFVTSPPRVLYDNRTQK